MTKSNTTEVFLNPDISAEAFVNLGNNEMKLHNFVKMILYQFASSSAIKEVNQETIDNFLQIANGVKPNDHIEALLITQMVTTHNAVMRCFNIVANTESTDKINVVFNSANKLLRSYAKQMEALSRYRNKGNQKIMVEHVHINSGGQAIIGNISKNDIVISK
jgi:hypothetical protein